MSQLGFTFYPKDWWTSDSFFLLQPYERYIYLECLFIMYSQDGWMSKNKLIVERRLGTTIKDEVWKKITDLFISDGEKLTHKSVNARMRKTLSNRENGLKGGRPPKPKEPNLETQQNPPLEIEEEIEKEKKIEVEKKESVVVPTQTSKIKSFKVFTKDDFKNSIAENAKGFEKEMLNKFYQYWTEPSPSGKMRFQLEKTWETARRLNNWRSREKGILPAESSTMIKRKRL